MFSRSCISSITKGFCITFRMIFGEFYDTNGIIEKFGGEEKFIEAVHRWYDNYRKGGRTKTPIIK